MATRWYIDDRVIPSRNKDVLSGIPGGAYGWSNRYPAETGYVLNPKNKVIALKRRLPAVLDRVNSGESDMTLMARVADIKKLLCEAVSGAEHSGCSFFVSSWFFGSLSGIGQINFCR